MRQMRTAPAAFAGATFGIRHWIHRTEEFWLLPRIELLHEIVSEQIKSGSRRNVLYISIPAGLPELRMPTGSERLG